MNRHIPECVTRLSAAGIEWEDAFALRRIAMTLHRWHELECGDANGNCVERDEKTDLPYLTYDWGTQWTNGKRARHRIPDREHGAQKRLAKIMAKYPNFTSYVQTDPRGAPLYVLTPYHMERYAGQPVDQIYNHGIAVYK